MLGVLLVHLGREVTVDQLISCLWSDRPPRTARSVIQVQVSHLRRVFPGMIRTTPGGYLADIAPEKVDLHRFRALRDQAETLPPEKSLEAWQAALDCWRGVPFSGVGSDDLYYTLVQPLLEERWAAATSWATNAISVKRFAEVVSYLTPLVRSEPLRERSHHLLISALWHSGERATALSVYEDFRLRLADELGVRPGADLVDLHARILQDEEDNTTPSGRGRAERDAPAGDTLVPGEFVVRNDLPRDIPDLSGRDDVLDYLRDFTGEGGAGAMVCAVTGSGGSGKTTVAVRAGYTLVDRFPDGQLFIDLHGYTANKEPLGAFEALGSLLRAVGVKPERVPDSLDERSALWRAMLMSRRLLLILDNARSYAQVSPLLPSSSGCLVLITSRNDLAGLNGARYLPLSMLSETAAIEFLTLVLGEERVRKSLDHAVQVVRTCGGMPLALRVIAGRMLSRPRWTFEHVARRLSDQNRMLRELQVDGRSVEAAIGLSYWSLGPDQRRAFLFLGLAVGRTLDLQGAAALLGSELEDADDLLQELVSVCLIEEPRGDVYRFHDLLAEFARQRAEQELSASEASDARLRQAEYFMTTAQQAADLLGPRAHGGSDGGGGSRYRWTMTERSEAEAWFEVHQDNIADVVDFYASQGNGEDAWRMADAVWRFYALRGQMGLLLSSHEKALAISRRQGNQRGSAVTLIGLGIAHYMTSRFDTALELLKEAHVVLARIGDRRGVVRALANLGLVYERLGRIHESAECLNGVLEQAVLLKDQRLEALQRGNLGVLYLELGDHSKALEMGEQVFSMGEKDELKGARAHSMRIIGEARTGLGDVEGALQALRSALELTRELGLRGKEVYVHNSFGTAYRVAGRWDEAIRAHKDALELAETRESHNGSAEILADLGITYAAASRHEEAAETLTQALVNASERGERYTEARAALGLGRLPAPVVDAERARSLLTDALHAFEEMGLPEVDQAREALKDL
ncbi:tetratricopeptide repeat protein [Nocardiopsis sp. B62]|nr:tetratricopeptide repeat protein [Nocardiopsis sp. B62]